jgi:hypothetical protein
LQIGQLVLLHLASLKEGESNVYLTSEANELEADGRLRVCSPPVPSLLSPSSFSTSDASPGEEVRDDVIPTRPPLMGALVPVGMNLWMGRASSDQGGTVRVEFSWS